LASAAVLVMTVSVLMNVSDPVVDTDLAPGREMTLGAASGLEEVIVTARRKQEAKEFSRDQAAMVLGRDEYPARERGESELAMADSVAPASPPTERQIFAAVASNESRAPGKVLSAPVPAD